METICYLLGTKQVALWFVMEVIVDTEDVHAQGVTNTLTHQQKGYIVSNVEPSAPLDNNERETVD